MIFCQVVNVLCDLYIVIWSDYSQLCLLFSCTGQMLYNISFFRHYNLSFYCEYFDIRRKYKHTLRDLLSLSIRPSIKGRHRSHDQCTKSQREHLVTKHTSSIMHMSISQLSSRSPCTIIQNDRNNDYYWCFTSTMGEYPGVVPVAQRQPPPLEGVWNARLGTFIPDWTAHECALQPACAQARPLVRMRPECSDPPSFALDQRVILAKACSSAAYAHVQGGKLVPEV